MWWPVAPTFVAAGLQTLIAVGASENFRAVARLARCNGGVWRRNLCSYTGVFGVCHMAFRSVLEMRFLDARHDGRVDDLLVSTTGLYYSYTRTNLLAQRCCSSSSFLEATVGYLDCVRYFIDDAVSVFGRLNCLGGMVGGARTSRRTGVSIRGAAGFSMVRHSVYRAEASGDFGWARTISTYGVTANAAKIGTSVIVKRAADMSTVNGLGQRPRERIVKA